VLERKSVLLKREREFFSAQCYWDFIRFFFFPFGLEIGYTETPTEYEISLVA
jgi:hypothetical protein